MASKNKLDLVIKNVNKVASTASVITTILIAAMPIADRIIELTRQKETAKVPDLCKKDFPNTVDQATAKLEKVGLNATACELTLSYADPKYRKCKAFQVVKASPSGGSKIERGGNVDISYVTQEVIDESERLYQEAKKRKRLKHAN